MLQEVHCTENTNHVWSAKWGYQVIFSNYKGNNAGVCILFNNNFDFQIEKVFIDTQGRGGGGGASLFATSKPMKNV